MVFMKGGPRAITVENRLEELNRVYSCLEGFAAEAQLPEQARRSLLLVTEELFTNMIHHGYEDGVSDTITIVFGRDGDDITNEAKEEGIGIVSAKYLPGARIVRAFNAMGYTFFASEANRAGERMAIPLAGDDKEAVATASTLVRDAGFDPVVVGPLARAQVFAQGGPLYGQQLTAQEFNKRLEAIK